MQAEKSLTVEARYHRLNDWKVEIESKYNRQYTGGGDEGLDRRHSRNNEFRFGSLAGLPGAGLCRDCRSAAGNRDQKVGGGFLQNAGSWIWMPTHIEFEVWTDNANFVKVADIKTDVAADDMRPAIRDYVQRISPVKARYVRVHAYNIGKIPILASGRRR